LYYPENNSGECEEETQPAVLKTLQPGIESCSMCEIINNSSRSFAKKIHTDCEKYGVQQTRNHNPFPKLVFYNELVGFKIGLNGYDNFFQQDIDLCKYKEKLLAFSY